ncbi:MAG TPA: carotenoid biosynthesis protein [Candidatus Acidoferrales bacterium]|nr:carotenoid biosynthesis protein [Candidatus Acidoferrales bacterium]
MKGEEAKSDERPISKLRWSLIGLFAVISIFLVLYINHASFPIIYASVLFVTASIYSIERYSFKNTAIFFMITWIVSLSFEALSIQTGFPFGFYHYNLLSPIILFQVPVIVIFAYFGAGYISWTLSHVLTGQYSKKLEGKQIFIVPFIAAFIMVMWDLIMDPIASTVRSQWVWRNPGPYFGVPLTNFFGWFLTVFIFYQLFALYLSKYDRIQPQKMKIPTSKLFWIEAPVVYGLIGLYPILVSVAIHNDITVSMSLVTVFTMLFVSLISFIAVMNNDHLR